MNKWEDRRGEITIDLKEEQLSTTAKLEKYRTTISYIPVYNTRNNVHRAKILDENVANTVSKPTQLQFHDFGMDVNLELSENRFVFNWPYPTKLNFFTGAFLTIIMLIFLWFLIGFHNHIYQDQTKMKSLVYIILLYVASSVAGKLISMVSKIPPFIGMILAGMALNITDISGLKIADEAFFISFCFYLSELMESVILIISCMELNIWKLRWTSVAVLKLAILPQIAETVTVVLVVHYFWPKFIDKYFKLFPLINFSGINSVFFMTSLGKLKHLGYFDSNNIYTLLNAASTLIDLLAVILNYLVMYSSTQSSFLTYNFENVALIAAKEIAIDTVFGILWGLLIVFVTSPNWSKQYNLQACEDNNNLEFNRQITSLLTTVKTVVLFFIGGFLIVLYKIYHKAMWSCSLSCGISSLVAGTYWRWRIRYYDNNKVLTMTYDDENEYQNQVFAVLKVFNSIWKYLQPLFFGFVGIAFLIEFFSFRILYFLPLLLVFQLIIRVIITTFAVWGFGFNRNELLFINIAWLPNSTLLSSLTPTCFMVVRAALSSESEMFFQILNLTTISIMITTILGSFAVQNYGPTLLSTAVNIK